MTFRQFQKTGDAKYTDLDGNRRDIFPFTCDDARYNEIPDPIYKLLGIKKPRRGPIHITRDNLSGSIPAFYTLEQAIHLINSSEIEISYDEIVTIGALSGVVLWLVSAGIKRIPLMSVFAGTQVAADDLCSRFDTTDGFNEFLQMDFEWQVKFGHSCDNLSSHIFQISSGLLPQ